jgi:hypothetical protein
MASQQLSTLGLDDRQRKFVRAYVDGGASPSVACRIAGYDPEVKPGGVLTRPVRAAIAAEVDLRLRCEGAVVGLSVLLALARDETTPKGVRAQCAVALMDRAGYPALRAVQTPDNGSQSLSEMSIGALRALVADLDRRAADSATDVTPEGIEALL